MQQEKRNPYPYPLLLQETPTESRRHHDGRPLTNHRDIWNVDGATTVGIQSSDAEFRQRNGCTKPLRGSAVELGYLI
jgi:hypothetical protein